MVGMENLNDFPARATVNDDGLWRTIFRGNGYRVDLECGNDCNVRIMDSDGNVVWQGHRWHAQALAGGLAQAATTKIGRE